MLLYTIIVIFKWQYYDLNIGSGTFSVLKINNYMLENPFFAIEIAFLRVAYIHMPVCIATICPLNMKKSTMLYNL